MSHWQQPHTNVVTFRGPIAAKASKERRSLTEILKQDDETREVGTSEGVCVICIASQPRPGRRTCAACSTEYTVRRAARIDITKSDLPTLAEIEKPKQKRLKIEEFKRLLSAARKAKNEKRDRAMRNLGMWTERNVSHITVEEQKSKR